ncbi:MAG: DUF4864 domain-containing protein [Rhodobacteraceae bacterium PARR1]|nr:MAG: DUF4864 domain-containing protein [Rhodobacteraceae bacterium PARR1]
MRGPAFAFLLALAALPAQAQDNPLQSTILNQIEAFKADDFNRAFSFASPVIKGIFGTADNFGMMVRNGYPMVHRPAEVQMLEQRQVSGATVQRVLITDAQGRGHVLDYQMVETPDGWQINGVTLVPSGGLGA